jgi:hypothetical protein
MEKESNDRSLRNAKFSRNPKAQPQTFGDIESDGEHSQKASTSGNQLALFVCISF